MPWEIAAVVAAINLATFCAFGVDKRAARSGTRRVRERTLLGLSWLAGAGGGWLGMIVFRHKTRKTRFVIGMIAVSACNLLWLLLILSRLA